MIFIEVISYISIFTGIFFFAVGTIGLLRMPDVYTRMHASTKCDTLGISLVMLGLILLNGISIFSLKLFVLVLFIWVTNPTAAHAIALAAFETREISDSYVPFSREEENYD